MGAEKNNRIAIGFYERLGGVNIRNCDRQWYTGTKNAQIRMGLGTRSTVAKGWCQQLSSYETSRNLVEYCILKKWRYRRISFCCFHLGIQSDGENVCACSLGKDSNRQANLKNAIQKRPFELRETMTVNYSLDPMRQSTLEYPLFGVLRSKFL